MIVSGQRVVVDTPDSPLLEGTVIAYSEPWVTIWIDSQQCHTVHQSRVVGLDRQGEVDVERAKADYP